jgi:hypothetical protein
MRLHLALVCAIATAAFTGSAAAAEGPARPKPRILPDSNVCVAVQVDQRVYPIAITDRHRFGFSATLAGVMSQLAVKRGFSHSLSSDEARFVVNTSGQAPNCQDAADVHVTLRYFPRSDGGRFRVEYEIRQGRALVKGKAERQIELELRSGKLPYSHIESPYASALSYDIMERARMLLDALTTYGDVNGQR